MLKLAIVGLGGLGKVHLRNVMELQRTRGDFELVALCDVEESRFHENIATNLGGDNAPVDLSAYRLYTDLDQMLAKERLDFAITALPTYLHADIGIKLLNHGIHLFSEKPMALNEQQSQAMIDAAQKSGKRLMIGQCLRYWPEYVKLKELIDSQAYGKVVRAEFFRYSATPVWSWQNWLMDEQKSGGAALDMHVHDVDFIQWALGMPEQVTSHATHIKSGFDSILTTYHYGHMLVTAACDWSLPPDYPFSASFLVRFEKATVKMDAAGMRIYPEEGKVFTPELGRPNAYRNEIDDFIDHLHKGFNSPVNPPESALSSVKLARAEMESARKGVTVHVH